MARFNPGDVVVANKTQIATVRVYDEETGHVVLVVGDEENVIYGHKNNFDLVLLGDTVAPEEPAVEDAGTVTGVADDGSVTGNADQITTTGLLS